VKGLAEWGFLDAGEVWGWSFGVAVSRVCGEVAKLAIVRAGLLAARERGRIFVPTQGREKFSHDARTGAPLYDEF
jgi:hypothetical protein